MLQAIRNYFSPPAIDRCADLRRFLSGEASYLAQRSTYEFTRNTLAWHGQSAFGDKTFNVAFGRCRWEAFAAILAGMVILTRCHLSNDSADFQEKVDSAMIALYRGILGDYPNPAHRPEGWSDTIERLRQRLATVDIEHGRDAGSVAATAATTVFAHLPVYSHDREENLRVITNAITFGMISFADRMRRRVRERRILNDLLAAT